MRDRLPLHVPCPGVGGGLDAAVDMPSGSVDMPSVGLSSKAPDMPSVGGGVSGELPSASLDASGSLPSGGVDVSVPSVSGAVDVPSVDLSGKTPDMPSVGGEIAGDVPSVDAKLTGPDVDVEGGGVSLGAGLAAGVTAAVGAAAVGLGLSSKADKPEGEVCMCSCGSFGGCRTRSVAPLSYIINSTLFTFDVALGNAVEAMRRLRNRPHEMTRAVGMGGCPKRNGRSCTMRAARADSGGAAAPVFF